MSLVVDHDYGNPSRKILGIIPARGGSKSIPGKNLCVLGGQPLILHTIHAAQKSRTLSDFIVSTDDPQIAEIARIGGARVPFLRPVGLAGDDSSIWSVVRHAVAHWEGETVCCLDAIVLLQPTSPLRSGEDIDASVARYFELKADLCATAAVSHDSPYFNMVEISKRSFPFARPCTPFMKKNARRQTAPPVYVLNGAVYVVRRSMLDSLENQFQVNRFAIYEMPRSRSVDVDVPEDLALAEFWLARGGSL